MEIKKSNGKVKFILDDEYLIKKCLFKDKKIKRENIRSALIYGSALSILTYDNKIFTFGCMDNSGKYIEGLKYIVNEINKEYLVFGNNAANMGIMGIWSIVYSFNMLFLHKHETVQAIIWGIMLIAVILIVVMSKRVMYIYNVETEQFNKIRGNSKEFEKIDVCDVEIKYDNGYSPIYKKKDSLKRFSVSCNNTNLIYPLNCVTGMNELNRKLKSNKK